MRITIDSKDISTVGNALESMAARGANLRPLMARLGVVMIASVHENFAAEGRPDKWKPLSASTIRSMEYQAVQQTRSTKRYQNAKTDKTRSKYEQQARDTAGQHKILVRTGDLRKSISVGEVTNESVEIGSSLPYARIQQLGGEIGPVTIRPRNKKALAIPTANGVIIRRSADIPSRKIPARPYLKLQDKDMVLFAGLTMEYLREGRV